MVGSDSTSLEIVVGARDSYFVRVIGACGEVDSHVASITGCLRNVEADASDRRIPGRSAGGKAGRASQASAARSFDVPIPTDSDTSLAAGDL